MGYRQQGFTLIELMVAMTLVGLVATFLFTVQTNISSSFRVQKEVSSTQHSIRLAREQITDDLANAGYRLTTYRTAIQFPNNFHSNPSSNSPFPGLPPGAPIPAVAVLPGNAISIADALILMSGDDGNVQEILNTPITTPNAVNVENPASFDPNVAPYPTKFVVLAAETTGTVGGISVARAHGCILEVTGHSPFANQVFFDSSPYNTPLPSGHCQAIVQLINGGARGVLMPLRARAYRINPTNRTVGILQMSELGGLDIALNPTSSTEFQDIGYGFTDMQIASRYYEQNDTVDLDNEVPASPITDWYSSVGQHPGATPASYRPTTFNTAGAVDSTPIQVSVTLVAKSAETTGTPTAFTPDITGTPASYNRFGDQPARATTASPWNLLIGTNKKLRSEYFSVDLRNLGAGLEQ